MTTAMLVEIVIKIALVVGGIMTAAAYFVLLERRVAAWVQDRVGPNRVGVPLTKLRLFGLGQPLADGAKFILKEEYTPAHVDKRLYLLAPIVMLVAALTVFAVVPFGSILPTELGIEGLAEPIRLVVAPGMDVAIFVIFALSSIAVYGVILGGWSSNNKYGFLGALRSSAQLIAYELPLGLGILGVVLAAGSLNLEDIMLAQASSGCWFAFAQPLGFIVFVVAAFAEAARLPFDLPECEQELVGGYHTEYSGIKLLLFLVAEFLHMITAAFLIVILFLGGWHLWGVTGGTEEVGWVQAILRVVVLFAKVFGMIFLFMLIRWSWPRFRYDQLMALAWKVMLPLGLVNLVTVAILDQLQTAWNLHAWWWSLILIGVNWAVCLGTWLVVAYAHPVIGNNQPQEQLDLYDVDAQV